MIFKSNNNILENIRVTIENNDKIFFLNIILNNIENNVENKNFENIIMFSSFENKIKKFFLFIIKYKAK